MMNDSVKNLGYGSEAERQALIYAEKVLKIKRVYADTRIHNKRSQRALEKAEFQRFKQDTEFIYYYHESV